MGGCRRRAGGDERAGDEAVPEFGVLDLEVPPGSHTSRLTAWKTSNGAPHLIQSAMAI
jgi:hypothetical protein